MPLRVVEVVASREHSDAIAKAAEQHGAIDKWLCTSARQQPAVTRILVETGEAQGLLDRLQTLLARDLRKRIVLMPAVATLPEVEEEMEAEKADDRRPSGAAREELFHAISAGVNVDGVFVFLVLLSTAVASIGMLGDNVAVVIAAMLIAPLLGPILAFAFAVALGERGLMLRAVRTSAIGFLLTIGVSITAGLLLPLDLTSEELLSRTDVSFDGIALALASGAAAALSLTTGVSSVLVGVMVAVALLPPAATLGFMLGAGETARASGAAMLLAVNLVCAILSAQIVFLARGIKPRTWWERKDASQSTRLSLIVSGAFLIALAVLIYIQHGPAVR